MVSVQLTLNQLGRMCCCWFCSVKRPGVGHPPVYWKQFQLSSTEEQERNNEEYCVKFLYFKSQIFFIDFLLLHNISTSDFPLTFFCCFFFSQKITFLHYMPFSSVIQFYIFFMIFILLIKLQYTPPQKKEFTPFLPFSASVQFFTIFEWVNCACII